MRTLEGRTYIVAVVLALLWRVVLSIHQENLAQGDGVLYDEKRGVFHDLQRPDWNDQNAKHAAGNRSVDLTAKWHASGWVLRDIQKLGQPGGMYTNILLVGKHSLPLVFYYQPVTESLVATACQDFQCTDKRTSTIASGGRSNSAVVSKDELPFVAFCQAMKGGEPNRLMGFKCSSPTCSPESDMAAASGQLQLLDPYGCDLYTAASLSDTNDLPVVAYFRKSNASFPAATWTVVCLDSMCSDFSRQPLQMQDGGFVAGSYPSVVVKGSRPIISAAWQQKRRDTDTRSSTPALFVCRDPHCVAPVRAILLYPAGDVPTQMDTRYTSVALTGNGNFVSTLYFDAFSESAFVTTVACGDIIVRDAQASVSVAQVDTEVGAVYGEFPHIMSDTNANAAFAYYRQVSRKQGDLMLVDCLDALCTNYSRTKIAQGKCGFGRDTALAFHPTASRLYISFMDYSPKSTGRAALLAIMEQSGESVEMKTQVNKFSDIC